MISFALSPVWTEYISSLQIPCRINLNREHVIPKSIISNRIVTEAPHNIIGFPSKLNSKRSNYKYVDSKKSGLIVWPCDGCRQPACPLIGKLNKEGFTPPVAYKPIIGASVLRSLYNHPDIIDVVHSEVLDIGLALEWTNSTYEDLPTNIKDIFRA